MRQSCPSRTVESPFDFKGHFVEERPKGSGTFVRLSDDVHDTVVYLGFPNAGTEAFDVRATGFLFRHESKTYIVTAAHVAKNFEDVPFGVRLNNLNGLAQVERLESVIWHLHQDSTVDVAVMEFEIPDWSPAGCWESKYSITPNKLVTKGIGAGDLAYIVGWFNRLGGERRNRPIVHTGHIAMMADGESIPSKDWRTADKNAPQIGIEGYLIEASTLDGLSGSPVFVRRSIQTEVAVPHLDSNPLKVWWHGSVWLLGLWHGAWVGTSTDTENERVNGLRVPAGMGICIPAAKIIELLNQPELKNMRDREKESALRERAPEQDSFNPANMQSEEKAGDALLETLLKTPPQPRATGKGAAKKKA